MTQDLVIRRADVTDVPTMLSFIFEHGANQWNYLPEDDVAAHFGAIVDGKTQAVIAEMDGALTGFVTCMSGRSMARYQSKDLIGYPHGYIGEAVVHRNHAGKGIGSRLLYEAIALLASQGFKEIYIERHEENQASAGMMRKAGFVEVDTFDDPGRRASGSRRTTVCRVMAA